MSTSLQLLVLTLFVLVIVACGSEPPGSSPESPTTVPEAGTTPAVAATSGTTPVPPAAPATSAPTSQAVQPGATEPVSTVDPTPEPTPTEPPARRYVLLTDIPCVESFWQVMLNYDGVEEFGPEVVQRLSDQFVKRRPDCAERGWDPGFPVEQVGRLYDRGACDTNVYFDHPDFPRGIQPVPGFLMTGSRNQVEGFHPDARL